MQYVLQTKEWSLPSGNSHSSTESALFVFAICVQFLTMFRPSFSIFVRISTVLEGQVYLENRKYPQDKIGGSEGPEKSYGKQF